MLPKLMYCHRCSQAWKLEKSERSEASFDCPNCGVQCSTRAKSPPPAPPSDKIRTLDMSKVSGKPSQTGKPSASFGEFIAFKTMITPSLIRVLWLLGSLGLIAAGVIMIANAVESRRGEEMMLLSGIAIATVGNLVWRVVCEGLILAFSSHEILASIDRKTR